MAAQMPKENYQRKLDDLIKNLKGQRPKLLLHSCCAPCSCYVLEYLSQYFDITVFYYNPNIYPEEEYRHRVKEQQWLISQMNLPHPVQFVEGPYDTQRFYELAKGLENLPEGGERCFRCYRLRLEEAAKLAQKLGCDYFTTTLSISPYKNAPVLNTIGQELGEIYQVQHLPSDFKKKNGYRRSVALSQEYGLYRQDYCGCVFSKQERQRQLLERQQAAEHQPE